MAQLKNLLEKEELDHIKEVKQDIKDENSGKKNFSNASSVKEEPSENFSENKNSGKRKGSKAWIWVAAIIAAIVILK